VSLSRHKIAHFSVRNLTRDNNRTHRRKHTASARVQQPPHVPHNCPVPARATVHPPPHTPRSRHTASSTTVHNKKCATALRYTAPSSGILVPSSPTVWRQPVQVHDHHLCPRVPPNPVYDIVNPGDDQVRSLPAGLQLGRLASLPVGRYNHTLSPS
jgi:hypothetical protein